ncbi:hypothetical protein AQUCO_12200001v1 [Aquilegia coerulea]|uniref:Uncharacterized protein n=1 Tax=Aquilegia coerulea TaxID=218851 RepID=A0A2G5C1Q2_AQUCA|nr:hypothetical protein AQUCO_12200001v1 [Aquilegia coerulea]
MTTNKGSRLQGCPAADTVKEEQGLPAAHRRKKPEGKVVMVMVAVVVVAAWKCVRQVTTTSSVLDKSLLVVCADAMSLLRLMSHMLIVKSLCLRGTFLDDNATNSFMGSSLERLDVSETVVSGVALARIIRRNPGLKCIKIRDSKNLCHLGGRALAYGSEGENVYVEIGRTCKLEDVEFGWGLSSLLLDDLGPALTSVKHVSVGLGASLSQHALMLLPTVCPLLESVILTFQVISDCIVKTIVESLRQLRVLGLCHCLGDLSPLGVHISMPNLRKLRLERVIPWMTNDDLVILTQNCTSLIELSLSGCRQLNSDSQRTISCGWPGLISLCLEDCGEVTSNGVSFLFDCKAIEDLLLRHSGRGIQRNFIAAATAKMPMLRKVALDLCDACEGGFESPSGFALPQYADRCFLSTVTIARCKQQKCAFELQTLEGCRRPVHKESIVMEWNSRGLRTTVVKERLQQMER